MPVTAEQLFDWHARPGAFARLNPPWAPVRELARTGNGIQNGVRVKLAVPSGPISIPWELEHRGYQDGKQFQDVQIRGPFRSWEHTHVISPGEAGKSELYDQIKFELPLGKCGTSLGLRYLKQELLRVFRYRHAVTRADLLTQMKSPSGHALTIAVSGAGGFVGTPLCTFLRMAGHRIIPISRTASKGTVLWDPMRGTIDRDQLEGVDAVIHLAGENIAERRWSPEVKREILESRSRGTRLLSETLASLASPPRVFLCASAIGIYGDRADELLSETSEPGSGFLPEVTRAWENATRPAQDRGIRVICARLGTVLSPHGGALRKMLLPFQLGLGGRLGTGRGWMSWIALDDLIYALYHLVCSSTLAGAVNLVAPNPVRNEDFTRTLGRVLGRPTLFPVPRIVLRAAFGELADEALLASARVSSTLIERERGPFFYPELEGALRHMLGRVRDDG